MASKASEEDKRVMGDFLNRLGNACDPAALGNIPARDKLAFIIQGLTTELAAVAVTAITGFTTKEKHKPIAVALCERLTSSMEDFFMELAAKLDADQDRDPTDPSTEQANVDG